MTAMRIYGYDAARPEAAAERYAHSGITAVVGGIDDAAARAFARAGLDYFVCCGCFTLPEEGREPLLCADCEGGRTAWFGSGCPNEPALREGSLALARRLSQCDSIRGVIIDAARFASPAGETGLAAFFTCFCPRCMEKMERLGFDAQKIRSGVRALFRHLRAGSGYREAEHGAAVRDWLRFRRACITEHLTDFTGALRREAPGLRLGIYAFAPSLAPLVGQSYADCSRLFDFVSPMLYRYYAPDVGVACLDHEFAALLAMAEALPAPAAAPVLSLFSDLTGRPLDRLGGSSRLRREGCPVALVAGEAERAARELQGCCALEPILALGDDRFADCVAAVRPVCSLVDCFAYNESDFRRHFTAHGIA